SYIVRDNSVARSGGVLVSYSDVGRVDLETGSAADGVTVLGTAAGREVRLSLSGNDVVNLGTRTGSSLDSFLGLVTVTSIDAAKIFVNDQVSSHGNSYLLGGGLTRNGTQVLNAAFDFHTNVTLNAGNFADTVTLAGAGSVTLNLGGGDDTVVIPP